MALQQSYSDPITGAVSNYHRIGAANVDYETKIAQITVLSYFSEDKREEEKSENKIIDSNLDRERRKQQLLNRINELLANPTDDNLKEREDVSAQLQAINEEEDTATYPDNIARYMYSTQYTIQMGSSDDYTLKYAYEWLKTNVYKDAKDV